MDDRSRHGDADGLDPLTRPGRWETLVASIVGAAGPELERRRREADLTGVLLGWARPALSAAAVVVLVMSAALAISISGTTDAEAAEPAIASVVVPEEYAAWLLADYEPTVTELVVALEGRSP